jgi:hypothetical protein
MRVSEMLPYSKVDVLERMFCRRYLGDLVIGSDHLGTDWSRRFRVIAGLHLAKGRDTVSRT